MRKTVNAIGVLTVLLYREYNAGVLCFRSGARFYFIFLPSLRLVGNPRADTETGDRTYFSLINFLFTVRGTGWELRLEPEL